MLTFDRAAVRGTVKGLLREATEASDSIVVISQMVDTKRFLLRLDPRLFDALRRWADDDLRSINAQIEYLLSDQARRAGRWPPNADTLTSATRARRTTR
jgi:hypothetical protein